ncbi:MAG: hypothetical protein Q7U04_11475 [Bacteriovorax sp.]|nr:hypothetical protein [Bacteriovorax sp.]
MDILKDDINRELSRIKEKLTKANSLTEEDLKIILLSMLSEEDLHESKQ